MGVGVTTGVAVGVATGVLVGVTTGVVAGVGVAMGVGDDGVGLSSVPEHPDQTLKEALSIIRLTARRNLVMHNPIKTSVRSFAVSTPKGSV